MTKPILTADDVAALEAFRDEPRRTTILEKVIDGLEGEVFRGQERDLALQIVRIMSFDISEKVREVLAWRVSRSRYLERDVAEHLARDFPAISFPVLRYSETLDDDWLVGLVEEGVEYQALAIAGRARLSHRLCEAIVDSRLVRAVAELSGNPGAEFSTELLGKVIQIYGEQPSVVDRLAQRTELPMNIVTRLVSLVSAEIRTGLITRYPESRAALQATLSLAEEASLVAYLLEHFRFGQSPGRAIEALEKENRLTPTFLLRLMVEGHIPLFAAAMAVKSGTDRDEIRNLLFTEKGSGMGHWCQRAHIPEQYLPLFNSAFATAQAYGFDIPPPRRKTFKIAALTDLLSYCRETQSFHAAELLFELFEGDPDNSLSQARAKARFDFPDRYPLPK